MTAALETSTELVSGLLFDFYGGTGVLVAPAPESAPEDRLWVVLTPSTGELQELVIGDLSSSEFMFMDELLQRLVSGWMKEKATRLHTEVLLARMEEKVEDIRSYAIDRQLEGHFCREGLNKALEHFDLEPYHPRYRLLVTATASIELDADSSSEAESRVRYLVDGLALSGDNDEEEVETLLNSVHVEAVEAL